MHYFTLNQNDTLERDIFETLILDAAESATPSYIADLRYDPKLFEIWIAEGRMRAAVNARLRGKKWQGSHQNIPGQELTADELGRVCEGAIETMLGLDVAAVNHDGTDNRPDVSVRGVRFDVKGSRQRPRDTFSLPVYQAHTKGYDALLLVQHIEPGLARVWCCQCAPASSQAWQLRQGVAGKKPFFLITCTPS